MNFINSFSSEWLKKKRSLASWLVVVGGFFTPCIILLSRFKNAAKLPALYAAPNFWLRQWNQSWESMAAFLLPIGIILAAGLVTQIEFKNNTWKQLHATPQRFSTIFFAKLLVVLVMLAETFVLFNVGMYLSGVIPSALFGNVPYPTAAIPYRAFLSANFNLYIDCLPILALQYLISLQFRNFLVPVGVGFAIWFLGIGLLSWRYSFFLPYNLSTIDFFISSGQFPRDRYPLINIHHLAIVYTAVFTIAAYVLYVAKKDKG
ncbi:MAG TPA: ABC transporter permease [Pyrinomonadaceae bacterium]|nr:ABC transporter permease [Pyrinomonadaceae bacterium]